MSQFRYGEPHRQCYGFSADLEEKATFVRLSAIDNLQDNLSKPSL